MPHDASACPICGGALPDAPLILDQERGIAVAGGKFVAVGGAEMRLLALLRDRYPAIVTKTAIMDHLYGLLGEEPDQKIVDVFVCKLRRRVSVIGIEIVTSWGVGYGLAATSATRKLEGAE